MTSPVLAVARPVGEPVHDEGSGAWTAGFTVAVTEDEPVFAGHYPDFPIFPGVCVMECVRRAAESVRPPRAEGLRLVAVESTRFTAAVHPGDELSVEVTWSPRAEGWRCAAKVATARGRTASVRLRYGAGAPTC
ncbi:dehydratase [Streptomyces toyocaensis]|uniref:Dehydratase n=1 Tax=Streptomyces toyocaensis TaxID=55952 RepID=A0A081XHI4_STRTO|nr:dehydratase [Streptomyces toyocaensis]KES03007.1 dehydratase [Streptomyces toyocaensis]